MGKSESNQKKIIIAVLCAVLCVMAVGYAAFQTRLNVDGTATIGSKWSVLFTDVDSATTGGATSGTPTVNATTIVLNDVKLTSPGDSIVYTITVANQGTLPARVSNFVWSEQESDAIRFTVSGLNVNDTIIAGGVATFTVTVTYDPLVNIEPSIKTNDVSVTVNFVQDLGSNLPTEATEGHTTMAPATALVSSSSQA